MPFRQPESTSIDADSVRSGGFSFRVEALLESHQNGGKLTVDASTGYLLTSSDGKAPRQHLTLDYVLQSDGSRVAHDTLMLLRGNGSVTDGTVTLSDPTGEQLTIGIVPGGGAVQLHQQPALLIDHPALHLAKTAVGEASFAILNIRQQFTDTPVSVVVDDPAQFTIATGERQLLFGSSLLFTPARTGTYIHVRYQPNRTGRHAATLYIETPYQTRTVRLTGRTTGLLPPTLHRAPTADRPPTPALLPTGPVDEPVRPTRRWLPALLVLGGLAGAGYAYRCELAPNWCREPIVEQAPQPAEVTLPAERPMSEAEAPSVSRPPEKSGERRRKRTGETVGSGERQAKTTDNEPVTRRSQAGERNEFSLSRRRSQPETGSANADGRRRARVTDSAEESPAAERSAKRRTTPPAQSTEESDLEQELNRKPGGNRQ